MKALLIIDMPNEAKAEDYYMAYGLFTNKGEKPFRVGEVAFECKKVDLKPLPNKWYEDGSTSFAMGIARGFNKCIDEILGETE